MLTARAMFTAVAVPATEAAAPSTAASAAQTTGSLTTGITGTVNGVAQTGTFTINRFVRDGSSILAVGNLQLGGTNFGTVRIPVNVTDPPGSCQILHLDLGPLDLNLLGCKSTSTRWCWTSRPSKARATCSATCRARSRACSTTPTAAR